MALANASGEILFTAEGICKGNIARAPRGVGGFGYDPYFLVPALGKTGAELPLDVKNGMSHRGQALASLVEKLKLAIAQE